MPIVRKSSAMQHLDFLEKRVNELRDVLIGQAPNPNTWDLYALSEEDYERDFLQIDPTRLTYALNDLEGLVKTLRNPKELQAEKLHRSK